MLTLLRSRSALLVTFLLTTTPVALLQAQTSQLEIVEASYGAGNYQMNVTPKLRGMVQNNALEVTADPSLLGGDPAPGSAKRLRVVYRFNGRQAEASAGDYEKLRIPAATNADWSAGAIPVNKTPTTAANPGGFSIGDIWNTPGGAAATATGLRIVSASYGAGGTSTRDVREYLQSLVRDNALSVKVDNAAMGGDPAPARAKTLEVTYEYRGTTFQSSVREGAYLALPDANARAATTTADNNTLAPKLRILTARYGGDNRFNDVRDRLQGLVRDNAVAFKVDNVAMGGDPAVGKDKSLELTYEWNGGVYSASVKEGKSLTLPEAGARPIAVAPPVAAAPAGRGADSDAARSAGNRSVVSAPVAGREITPIGTAGGLRIFYARYGAQGQDADVREQLRPLLQGETLRATVGLAAMGSDPAPGVRKMLTVIYEYRGRTYEKAAYDGEALTLP